MKDKTIAILENRVGEQMADLIRKYGGTPFSASALAEIPDIDPAHIIELFNDWDSNPPDTFIFQTGVGVKRCSRRPIRWDSRTSCCTCSPRRGSWCVAPSRPRCCARATCASTWPPRSLTPRPRCSPSSLRRRCGGSAWWCSATARPTGNCRKPSKTGARK